MTNKIEYCAVDVSWIAVDEKQSVSDLVVFRVDEDDESENTCTATPRGMTFEPKGKENSTSRDDDENIPQSLTLTITCRNPPYRVRISAIDVICEAKHLEIFSATGEYVDTCRGIRIDEEIGFDRKLFMMQHSFEPTQHSASIKLLSLLDKTKCFVHSVYVTVCPSPPGHSDMLATPLGGPTIDLEKVKSLLPEMSEMSGSAKSLLQNMEIHQKNQSANQAAMAKMVSGMFPGCGSNPSMSAMMSMFTGMAVGTTGTVSGPEQQSRGLGSNPNKEVGVCSDLPVDGPKSAPPAGDAGENGQDGEEANQSTCSAPNERNLLDFFSKSENVTSAVSALEEKFLGHMKESEARMAELVSMKIKQSEDRIMSKLDEVLSELKR